MDIRTRILIWLKGRFVGEDSFGNRYYESRKQNSQGMYRRWVLYKGWAEASKIPAAWHNWIHQVTAEVPRGLQPHFWEKPHEPNATGTSKAYSPWKRKAAGDPVKGPFAAPKLTYEPWNPNQ